MGKIKTRSLWPIKPPLTAVILNVRRLTTAVKKCTSPRVKKATLFTTFFDGYTLHSDTKIVLENCIRNFRIQATGVLANDFFGSAKTADPKATLNMHLLGKAKQGITKTLRNVAPVSQYRATLDQPRYRFFLRRHGARRAGKNCRLCRNPSICCRTVLPKKC